MYFLFRCALTVIIELKCMLKGQYLNGIENDSRFICFYVGMLNLPYAVLYRVIPVMPDQ